MVFWRLYSPRAPGPPAGPGEGDETALPDPLHKIKKLLGAGTRNAPLEESSPSAPVEAEELAQVAEFDEVMAAARACVEAMEEATSKLQMATGLLEDFVDKSYGKNFLNASCAKDILTHVHDCMDQLKGALPHTRTVKGVVDEAGRRSAAVYEAYATRDQARSAKEEAQSKYDHLVHNRKDYTLAQTQVIMGARASAKREYEDRAAEAATSMERILTQRPHSTGAVLAGVCSAYAALVAGGSRDLVERLERAAHGLSSGSAPACEVEEPAGLAGLSDAQPAQPSASGSLPQEVSQRSPTQAESGSSAAHPNPTVASVRVYLEQAQAQDDKDPLAAHYCRTQALEVLVREKMAGNANPEAQELLYQTLSQAEERRRDLDLTNGPERMEELALRSLADVEKELSSTEPAEAGTLRHDVHEEFKVAEVLVQSLAQFSNGALSSEHTERLEKAREAVERKVGVDAQSPCQSARSPCQSAQSLPPPVSTEGSSGTQLAESGVETDSSSDFTVGEVVFMWSNSAGAWLPATVEQVFHEAGHFQQYAVAAGVVQLVCHSGTKFVHPSQFKEVIRKRGDVPRTAQCGG